MTGPDPNDPLSPYFPAETPDVPGNGRKWAALLLALLLLVGAGFGVLSLLASP
ncbi:MAG: hypothetical protein ABEJ78_10700 [Haloferacaceae archaeon]